MSWEIIIAAAAGVIAFYLFRYQAERELNFWEYIVCEWRALAKAAVGAGLTILLWTYISTVLAWVGINITLPVLKWDLAAAIGCLGRLIYKYGPNIVKAVLEIFGKRFYK